MPNIIHINWFYNNGNYVVQLPQNNESHTDSIIFHTHRLKTK